MEDKIIEGNKLIAEFMGLVPNPHDGGKTYGINAFEHKYGTWFADEWIKLNYENSWSDLMPVVEKIAKNYDVRIIWYDGDCNTAISKRNIEQTDICDYGNFNPFILNIWHAVVEFIKWHNQNK